MEHITCLYSSLLGTHVKLKPLLWHMGGEYYLIASPKYPPDSSRELRFLTTAHDVIRALAKAH